VIDDVRDEHDRRWGGGRLREEVDGEGYCRAAGRKEVSLTRKCHDVLFVQILSLTTKIIDNEHDRSNPK